LRQMRTARGHSSRNRRQAESSHPSGISPIGFRRPADRASGAHRPGRVEKHNGVSAFEAEVDCLVVVAVYDPRLASEQAALLLAPLAFGRCNPAGLPEMEVEMNDRQARLRSKRAREGALPGTCQPSHEDTAAYHRGGISHRQSVSHLSVGVTQNDNQNAAGTTLPRRARSDGSASCPSVGRCG
jgi:hypothetical protein